MMYDIFNVLKFRRHSVAMLQAEIERLKKLKESKLNNIDPRHCNGSFVLRVTLKPSDREIVFCVGQKLLTPMGVGEVSVILPDTGALHIKLPSALCIPIFLPSFLGAMLILVPMRL